MAYDLILTNKSNTKQHPQQQQQQKYKVLVDHNKTWQQ